MDGVIPVTNISDIREALATALNNAAIGLRAQTNAGTIANPPVAVILPIPGTFIDYDVVMGMPPVMGEPGGSSEANYTMRIVLLVSAAADRAATLLLDGFLESSGPNSVRQAIAKDPTLGGVVEYAVVTSAQGYGMREWAGVEYLASDLIVTVAAA